MVTRGSVRGNGKALAYYLTTKGDNERIEILDIDGRKGGDRSDLVYHLTSWSLMSELTKSDKGLYHAVINPAYGEDKKMTPEDWNRAADILAKETGFEGQRRAIVLHEKQGRIHAHVVYERYDHEREIMISDSFLRLAQDRARQIMEKEFEHQITPHRNSQKNVIKKEISEIWCKTSTGKEFVSACEKKGYSITRTSQRRSFSIVDETGISYDLPRQVEGVKTKEIAERLNGLTLKDSREVIRDIRSKQSEEDFYRIQENALDRIADFKNKREAQFPVSETELERKKRIRLQELQRQFTEGREQMLKEKKQDR